MHDSTGADDEMLDSPRHARHGVSGLRGFRLQASGVELVHCCAAHAVGCTPINEVARGAAKCHQCEN